MAVKTAVALDEYRLARQDVAHQLEIERVHGDALGSHHVFGAFRGIPPPKADRANAVRIAEGDDAVPENHGDHRVTAAAAPVQARHGREYPFGRQFAASLALQLIGKDIEQRLGVGAGIQVAPVVIDEELLQLRRIRQVAVVREADSVWRVDVKRLRLRRTRATGRRIPRVADADVALEAQHMPFLEHVADQSQRLAAVKSAAFLGIDAGGVLAAVLENRQGVINRLVDRAVGDYADNATHGISS